MFHSPWFRSLIVVSLFATLRQRDATADEIMLRLTRDNWVSGVGEEALGNNGGSSRLKLKSIQELSLIDFDTSPLRGRVLERAVLKLKRAGDETLDRVTISTLTAPWVEGDGQSYAKVPGASTFAFQRYPDQRWGLGDLTHVTLGQGGSRWSSQNVRASAEEGWLEMDFPVDLLGCRTAGICEGFLLMDDTGSEWTRDGEKFDFRLFPNRYVFSRDSNRASEPVLVVQCSDLRDTKGPDAPIEPRWLTPNEQDPRYGFTWMPPRDQGETDVVGYVIHCDGQSIPQRFAPAWHANQPAIVRLHPQDAHWDLHAPHEIKITAVDAAGNQGKPVSLAIPAIPPTANLSWQPPPATGSDAPATDNADALWKQALEFQGCRVAVIDPLDKLLPESGRLIPAVRATYLNENALWDAPRRRIHLSGGGGQWVGFQLALRQPPSSSKDMDHRLSVEFRTEGTKQAPSTHPRIEVSQYLPVKSAIGQVPDPLSLIGSGAQKVVVDLKSESPTEFRSWLIEVYIPHEIAASKLDGKCTVSIGGKPLEIGIELDRWPLEIPDRLSFLPEMNCYDLPANERDYYRLGHRHRVLVHRVPYFQNGRVAEGCAPKWDGKTLDWSAWDARFGPLLDGSLFKDLPRGTIPLECLYLPLHENWPLTMEEHYRGGYWASEAFSDEYRAGWSKMIEAFQIHLSQRGWTQTRYLGFLNNKVDFKKRGWSRGSSVWLLDEPASFQDYVALHYFGSAFHEGSKNAVLQLGATKPAPFEFRADISRPQWQRDLFDPILNYNVVSQSAFREYRSMVLDRKWRFGQTVMLYGTTNHPTTNNTQALAWCWDAWLQGADGVLPWQTIGRAESWREADELALFYPSPAGPSEPPLPSVRLKAYTYGQQDIEVLRQIAARQKLDRFTFGEALARHLPLRSVHRTDAQIHEDAGWADYGALTPEQFTLWRRGLVGTFLYQTSTPGKK